MACCLDAVMFAQGQEGRGVQRPVNCVIDKLVKKFKSESLPLPLVVLPPPRSVPVPACPNP